MDAIDEATGEGEGAGARRCPVGHRERCRWPSPSECRPSAYQEQRGKAGLACSVDDGLDGAGLLGLGGAGLATPRKLYATDAVSCVMQRVRTAT